jgi:pantoate--beta-alanine ligase
MSTLPSTSVPRLITSPDELRRELATVRRAGTSVGLVPTMGALHAGHLSLVDACRRAQCGLSLATIFVNPTQFGPQEDFARYPRPLNADLRLLADRGVDLVFAPDTQAMYGAGHATRVEVAGPALPLEGAFRAGHFSGVATIVLKLLNLVQPERAFFGQKDYQQTLVVRRMVADLEVPTEIVVCPIVRDADGLALSSRNVYLSAAERVRACSLSQALARAREMVAAGKRDTAPIVAAMEQILRAAEVQIDYVTVRARDTLEPLDRVDRPAVALLAGRVGATRLIDNELLG